MRPFRSDGTAGDRRWQISTSGGIEPRWPRLGKEIFYIASNNMLMAVDVKANGTFEAGIPRPLFSTRSVGVLRYDVAADGQRFLMAVSSEQATSEALGVILNWFEELKRVPSN